MVYIKFPTQKIKNIVICKKIRPFKMALFFDFNFYYFNELLNIDLMP